MYNFITFFGAASANCYNTFLGLVHWYQYLPLGQQCQVQLNLPKDLDKVWLIGIAGLEDLLRIAGMVAVAYVIYGGIRYITSQGEPEHTRAALSTIINALVGLSIAIVAASFVGFLGNSLGGQNTGTALPNINPSSATQTILNIVFGIIGSVSFLMVVYGGFRFVISRGNPDATSKARNTVIYAVIGLAVTLVAFSAVNFVVGNL
jgi:TRAP-type C4-dicarboxylate transport system permease small subunit